MTDIEIPLERERHGWYRFFEILPGLLTWTLLFTPLILSFINVTAAAFFILAYVLIYFTRSIAVDVRAIQGHRMLNQYKKINWNELIADVQAGQAPPADHPRPRWHLNTLMRLQAQPSPVDPNQLYHAIIIATVNETKDVLEPTLHAILHSNYDLKRVILVFAYEARAGQEAETRVHELLNEYRGHFHHAMAVKHPFGIPDEVIGKGGNVTYAARELQRYLEDQHIDPVNVVVTTLDSDNRVDKDYLSALSYLYCVAPDPIRASYQPLPMYTNNIWDAPAPMRVIATGNNFFYIVLTQRPHLERNFSAHAQSMRALIDMDFWSVRTVVEDGHHFWRSYFFYDGDYRVYPLTTPIYQDAVLAATYWKTIRAQFIQLRRWTYGASDVAYVASKGFRRGSKVPKFDVIAKWLRLLEGHVSWGGGAIIMLTAGFIPAFINPQSYAANELPLILSRINTVGLLGLLASLYVSMKTLPPRPPRYKRHRSLFMLLQWVYLPVTTICFGSLAALNSQTRLIFKRYLSKFDVTEKAVVKTTGERVSSEADPSRR
ncbi:MAG TPA: glycosyltransferase family 2 protein [Candidatus Saccharimonadales bacterium]|nr:glycosyltransferase family 2 protein [Candidatus Saccharimonadales bacterium]